jgi:hypothetical protein
MTTSPEASERELPPLPAPRFDGVERGGLLIEDGYTAEQMREYARAALRAPKVEAPTSELLAQIERLKIRGEAYEKAYGVAYRATYQSHNGHWDSTMQGGAGCRECIAAREARAECDVILRDGLDKLAERAALSHPLPALAPLQVDNKPQG